MGRKIPLAASYTLSLYLIAGAICWGGLTDNALAAKTATETVKSTDHERDHRHNEKPKPHTDDDGHDHSADGKKAGTKPHTDDDGHGHSADGKKAGTKPHTDDDGHGHSADGKKAGPQRHTDDDGHGHSSDGKKAGSKPHADHAEDKDDHGHGAHAEKGHGDEAAGKITLTSAQMREFGITTTRAMGGPIDSHIVRPAEIKFNEDRIVHVVPRVDGTVKSVFGSEGQFIKKGALIAVLDSRELADAKAEYLASLARFQLAKENLDRDQSLSRRKIVSEKRFLDTRTKHIEAQIALRVATQKLRALGLSSDDIRGLPKADDETLSLFSMRAPFSGIITERHIVVGETRSVDKEALTSRNAAFVIADLSKVWVDISIFPKDFKAVRKGQRVNILLEDGGPPVIGEILFMSPHVLEETRTGFARVVLDNSSRRLHPGVYIKAKIATTSRTVGVRIPKQAVQTGEHGRIVFVKEGNGFEAREIQLGEENHGFVEVKSGLKPGEIYVSAGAFIFKAQLGKAAFGDGHNH